MALSLVFGSRATGCKSTLDIGVQYKRRSHPSPLSLCILARPFECRSPPISDSSSPARGIARAQAAERAAFGLGRSSCYGSGEQHTERRVVSFGARASPYGFHAM